MLLVAAYAHNAISEISGMTIKLMRVDRIDRGRARRAWEAWEAREAFSLIIVSPVVVARREGVRSVRFKPTQARKTAISKKRNELFH